jgi:glycosyltransferase involved in cell wall biosynthesis
MRILLDARFMDATWAAPSAYARQLVEHLSRVDDKNEYLVVVRPSQKDRLPVGPNFEVVSYRPHPLSVRSLMGFHQLLDDIEPDLVHFLSPVVPFFYRGPTMVTVHDLRPLTKLDESARSSRLATMARAMFARMVYPTAFRRSLWILCSSYTVRHELLRIFPHLAAKLITVLPGLPAEAFEPVPDASIEAIRAKCEIRTDYIFASVPGHAARSLAPLVRAFALAVSRDPEALQGVHLVMSAGKDGTMREVRRAISQSRIGDRILMLEGLEREEERALIAGARAFAFPARHEGAGMTVLGAMALGVPVVASHDGALPEVCSQGGLYADPDDTAGYATILQQVLKDDDLRQRLSQNGRDMARQRDWIESARLVREIYQDLF